MANQRIIPIGLGVAMATALHQAILPLDMEDLVRIIISHPESIIGIGRNDMIGLVLEQVFEGQVRGPHGLIQVVEADKATLEGPIFRPTREIKETGLQHIEEAILFNKVRKSLLETWANIGKTIRS